MTPRQRAEQVVEEYRQSVMSSRIPKKDIVELISEAIKEAVKEFKATRKRRVKKG